MRGLLFGIFIIAVVITELITAIGLLANWGIWIKSPLISAGQELPFLNKLVTGSLLAFAALAIEVGRRWFIAKNIKSEVAEVYLDLLAAAVILPTTDVDQADTNFTMVSDYFDDWHAQRDEETKIIVRENLKTVIGRMKGVRYGGATEVRRISEVLPRE